ncbi:MAG: DUF1631 domain-containing protein [Betaproteobacteria bacterium]|nr:DUF1631 domain-containing protein [Betaproteobacteria bacterium]NCP81421.1 DUF1631 domain-containing protein [Rhodoferax sp.]NCS60874.1 DUF1631 domain-containing protein [Rhodoferax sp.]PJC13642.1 MAG: hypothetical protein CO065_15930 [Comamonadaceae bacterium CG_4_9_14_0_8_um_filter_57_21]
MSELSGPNLVRYKAFLTQAAAGGSALLARVLGLARQSMHDDAVHLRVSLERDQLGLCVKLLDNHAARLCDQYPKVLEAVFSRHNAHQSRLGEVSTSGLRLEQLALMDEDQVQERVVIARALQQVLLNTQHVLTDLNPYLCALQGLRQVSASRNPLRPDAYVLALEELMTKMSLPASVRSVWLEHMASPLGNALGEIYSLWLSQLQSQGVQPAVFVMVQRPSANASQQAVVNPPTRAPWSPQHRTTALNLGRLRRLMSRELDLAVSPVEAEKPGAKVQVEPTSNKDSFALQFAREFEEPQEDFAPSTDFDATVPAAFETLQEMQQADQTQVLQRMTHHPSAATRDTAGGVGVDLTLREKFIYQAKGMAQVLSLEVVALMIDNLVQDQRLPEPVRLVLAQLEPALMRLVPVDARFFSNKQHPARRLLQEITEHGLAFSSQDEPLFAAFMASLERFVSPLSTLSMDSAAPFAVALASLELEWELCGIKESVSPDNDEAKVALKVAEDRHLLANKMAAEMRTNTELKKMPQSVVDFLLGPWAQVMASAQLNNQKGSNDPGGYKALVAMLLWSAQPELTTTNLDQLTKLVPRLLVCLREGLRLIDYPPTKTSLFFDVLMKLHQQAFDQKTAQPVTPANTKVTVSLAGEPEGWVAPEEARVSGLMSLQDEIDATKASVPPSRSVVLSAVLTEQDVILDALNTGCWVELRVNLGWSRTQLTWISPQKTMYLFTNIQGKTQSMTKRMLLRLSQTGAFKVLAEQPVVEDALDGVLHTAMVNSLDLRLE